MTSFQFDTTEGNILLSWFQLSPMEWDAIHLSMSVALSSMLWSLPFAIFIAWLLARKEFYGKSLVTGIIHLPLVLPPVVIGYLLLVAMGRNGFIGKYLYQWFGEIICFLFLDKKFRKISFYLCTNCFLCKLLTNINKSGII